MKQATVMLLSTLVLVIAALAGCARDDASTAAGHGDHDQDPMPPSNRIDVPSTVRRNLGITFVKVEHRPVAKTLRLPGAFELRPDGKREYRMMIAGRVDLHVAQFDRVHPETALCTIDSPRWRELQHETVEAAGAIKLARAQLRIATARQDETRREAELLRGRLAGIAAAEMRNIELEVELARLGNQLPRLAAEVEAAEVELAEAREHYASRLRTLASVTGLSVDALLEPMDDAGTARWSSMETLTVRAGVNGVVTSVSLTDGGWAEVGGLVMTVADPAAIRFRAEAMQSDLDRLRDGQHARIVPPAGGELSFDGSVNATVSLGICGSPEDRTLPIYAHVERLAPWCRPGVSAFVEVFTHGTEGAELAIPTSAIVRDGVTHVFFRRDPKDPDKVIRVEGDLGVSDGRWTVVKSGVRLGDQVVVDGAYQLMLASSGSMQQGGHFHADGTFHADDH